MQEIIKNAVNNNLHLDLSLERFGRYLEWADNDEKQAYELYALNTQVSEALYTPLQMIEVILRNKVHTTLCAAFGDDWFQNKDVISNSKQQNSVKKVLQQIKRDGKEQTPGQIVSNLTFGFWTSLFNKEYEELWRKTLLEIAKKETGKYFSRKDFSEPLTQIRKLRNRIAHHEPILHWDLEKHHSEILTLLRHLSPTASKWTEEHSRFTSIFVATNLANNTESKKES